ncbi:hypothetical protein D915_008236 [Fasciola hepatica]|uniref:Uncharacterized protein n=1 Tax=Fasciola hepatica TaxID=6192 RepID=A0A2H1BZJ0_FASHE|nr:hypothetical protein D915_008236 [Fasciola hepatica]
MSSKFTLQLRKNKISNSSTRKGSLNSSRKSSLSNTETCPDDSVDTWSAGQPTQFNYYVDGKSQNPLPRRATIIPYITLTNESPLLNPELLAHEKNFDLRSRRSGSRYLLGGSRGSLPFTPSVNIPEAIPEVVMPRRHTIVAMDNSDDKASHSGLDIPGGEEEARLSRSYSPLRPTDLVVPCSNTFEQVLRNMELDHARHSTTEEY